MHDYPVRNSSHSCTPELSNVKQMPTHLALKFSQPGDSLRDYYEERYLAKTAGRLRRLYSFHLADNRSLARRIKVYMGVTRMLALDVGAGAAEICSSLGVDRLVLLDISEELLCSRGTRDKTAGICGLAESLPLSSGSVDFLIATQVLEHVPDYRRAIGEFGRVTRKGGILILAVPSHYEFMMKIFHRVSREIDTSGHLRAYHPDLLLEELGEEFRIVSTRQTGYGVFWLLMRLEQSRHGSTLVAALNSTFGSRPSGMLSRLLDLENAIFRRIGGGMSYEVIAVKV